MTGLIQHVDKNEFMQAVTRQLNRTSERVVYPTAEQCCKVPTPVYTKEDIIKVSAELNSLNEFLLFSELILAEEVQRFVYRILEQTKADGLYRQEIKKYVNYLKEVVDDLMNRCKWYDRDIIVTVCGKMTKRLSYAHDFYEDGCSVLSRFSTTFSRVYKIRIKLLQLDCKKVAKLSSTKYKDLASELYALLSLAQTGVELYDCIHRSVKDASRGIIRCHAVKHLHNEKIINTASNILYKMGIPVLDPDGDAIEVRLMRKHLKEFHEEITGVGQMDLFRGQMLAVQMDYIEYFLARLRMDMINKRITLSHIREIWDRLSRKDSVREFFEQMKTIRIEKEEDAMDLSQRLMTMKGDFLVVDAFRKLMLDDDHILPTDEEEKQREYRILRRVARRNGGLLNDEDIAILVAAHGTKTSLMEQLKAAGPELLPTLRRVRKMKSAELKQLVSNKC